MKRNSLTFSGNIGNGPAPAVLRTPPPAPLAVKRPAAQLNTTLPRDVAQQFMFLPNEALSGGINVCAGRGSGKSRLMGRIISWQALLRDESVVIFDPVGGTIDNLLDKIIRAPELLRDYLLDRVVYIDMSSAENVVPLPLFYRLGTESAFTVAGRFPGLVAMLDTHLEKAPMLGLNALTFIAVRAGMVLSNLWLQITETSALLANPESWARRLREAAAIDPDVRGAAEFFLTEYADWSHEQRALETKALTAKIDMFDLDPATRAMFGASVPGIIWPDVVENKKCVLFDLRGLTPHLVRFKLMAALSYLLEYVKHRGKTRSNPINVIIDELAYLSQTAGVDEISAFDREFNDLCNTWMRQGRIHLTCAYQEPYQLSDYTLKTTMSLGTQIMGVVADMDAALSLAKQYFPVDPWRVKIMRARQSGPAIELEPEFMSTEEQHYLGAEYFKSMRLFEFLVRPSRCEGDVGAGVRPVSIRNIDRGIWPDEVRIQSLRRWLGARSGLPVRDVLNDINHRTSYPWNGDVRPDRIRESGTDYDDDNYYDPLPENG